MSYLPIFGRRASTINHNDFAAFGGDSDGEDEEDAQPLSTVRTSNFPLNRSRSPALHSPSGPIALGNNLQDPLSTAPSLRQEDGGSSSNITTTPSLPGGYDFEPQSNEGNNSSSHHASTRRPPPRLIRNNSADFNNRTTNPSSTSNLLSSLGERYLPSSIYSRFIPTPYSSGSSLPTTRTESREDHGLLFSQEDDEEGDHDESYPPRGTASHIPLPARPPSFAPPPSGRIFGGGQGMDGVFSNLSAKPDGPRGGAGGGEYVGGDDTGGDKDEIPPSYEAAALDSTPPYWETTIITPGGMLGPDDICVDGLPVGNFFSFAWSMLVSMSFQFIGFLLTYLLHTTHAAKNGSRAGLGITLIQLGLYVKQRAEHPEYMDSPGDMSTGLESSLDSLSTSSPTNGGTLSWWGNSTPDPEDVETASPEIGAGAIPTQVGNSLGLESSITGVGGVAVTPATTTQSLGNFSGHTEYGRMSDGANEYMAFFLVTIGCFLLIHGFLSYWKAVRWARAVRQDMSSVNQAV